jgi:hypothetical protein
VCSWQIIVSVEGRHQPLQAIRRAVRCRRKPKPAEPGGSARALGKEIIVDKERSAHFWGKSKGWVGLGALGALGAAALALALGGQEAALTADRSPSVVPDMTGSAPSAGVSASAPSAPPRWEPPRRREERAGATSGARRRVVEPGVNEEQKRLLASAHRELEQLAVQEPTNFLVIFDMMKESGKASEKAIDAGRRASHAYILARTHILEGMLRRFIDDPESDDTLETDALARLDADFRAKMDALTPDVPAMASLQDVLTTTILKAPAFTDLHPKAD